MFDNPPKVLWAEQAGWCERHWFFFDVRGIVTEALALKLVHFISNLWERCTIILICLSHPQDFHAHVHEWRMSVLPIFLHDFTSIIFL